MLGRRRTHITLAQVVHPDQPPRVSVVPRRRPPRWLPILLLAAGAIIGALVLITVTRQPRPTPGPLGIPGKWHLILDSEFDGSTLPPDWRAGWLASGVTLPANTLEDDCYSPGNVRFPGDGTMHLDVTQSPSTCHGVTKPFTGALVSTDPDDGRGRGFQYTYGVLQAQVYLPADGSQLADWPAVWATGQAGSDYGEDDVIEGLAGVACWHFHLVASQTGGCDNALKPGWHTVASWWRKGAISFYYDGTNVGSITSGITTHPMYLLLDNTTTANGPVPDSMRVRYVRVWQASS